LWKNDNVTYARSLYILFEPSKAKIYRLGHSRPDRWVGCCNPENRCVHFLARVQQRCAVIVCVCVYVCVFFIYVSPQLHLRGGVGQNWQHINIENCLDRCARFAAKSSCEHARVHLNNNRQECRKTYLKTVRFEIRVVYSNGINKRKFKTQMFY
jgi:hypothetical protein